MIQYNTSARAGRLFVPEHLRGNMSYLQDGAKLQILEYNVNGDPNRVMVRIDGQELELDKRFVIES